MTISQFALRWLAKQGMIDTESAYDTRVGQEVLRLVEFLEREIHGLKDILLLFALVTAIYKAYDDQECDIWYQFRGEQRRKAS